MASISTRIPPTEFPDAPKLACHEVWLPARVYLPEAEALTLDQLYVALDFLDTHSAAIEREVFFRTADRLNADVDLIFWDTTSVYFAIDDEDEAPQTRRGTTLPPLRKRGHSKDRRDGDPQVVVGLALTRDGLPVRSWVFPGNTVDATTVSQVKADLRGWKLGRAIFVGDAGMDSEANQQALARGLGHYILAMPLGKRKVDQPPAPDGSGWTVNATRECLKLIDKFRPAAQEAADGVVHLRVVGVGPHALHPPQVASVEGLVEAAQRLQESRRSRLAGPAPVRSCVPSERLHRRWCSGRPTSTASSRGRSSRAPGRARPWAR